MCCWRRKRQPTPVFMPGKSHGPRSLVDYNPWGRKESDTTEWLLCVCVCVCKCADDYLLKPRKWFVFFFVFVIVFLYEYIICVFFGHSELTRGSLRTVVQPHDLFLLAQTHFLVINIWKCSCWVIGYQPYFIPSEIFILPLLSTKLLEVPFLIILLRRFPESQINVYALSGLA